MIFPQDLDHWFSYHPPREDQIPRFCAIRDAARAFAQVILDQTQCGTEQAQAIWKVRETVMAANAAIACETDTRERGAA